MKVEGSNDGFTKTQCVCLPISLITRAVGLSGWLMRASNYCAKCSRPSNRQSHSPPQGIVLRLNPRTVVGTGSDVDDSHSAHLATTPANTTALPTTISAPPFAIDESFVVLRMADMDAIPSAALEALPGVHDSPSASILSNPSDLADSTFHEILAKTKRLQDYHTGEVSGIHPHDIWLVLTTGVDVNFSHSVFFL